MTAHLAFAQALRRGAPVTPEGQLAAAALAALYDDQRSASSAARWPAGRRPVCGSMGPSLADPDHRGLSAPGRGEGFDTPGAAGGVCCEVTGGRYRHGQRDACRDGRTPGVQRLVTHPQRPESQCRNRSSDPSSLRRGRDQRSPAGVPSRHGGRADRSRLRQEVERRARAVRYGASGRPGRSQGDRLGALGGVSTEASLPRDTERFCISADEVVRAGKSVLGGAGGAEGGILAAQVPIFRLGLGARLGDGRQWTSWVALDDEIGVILRAIDDSELIGPVNSTSPNPVRNAELTDAIAASSGTGAGFCCPRRSCGSHWVAGPQTSCSWRARGCFLPSWWEPATSTFTATSGAPSAPPCRRDGFSDRRKRAA